MIKSLLLVFLGGGTGSIMRYAVSLLCSKQLPNTLVFPWATFAVNVVGSFVIGLLSAFVLRGWVSSDLKLLLITGLCGGFTTFSTFSAEGLAMVRNGDVGLYLLYVGLSVIAGLAAAAVGLTIAK